MITPSHKNIGIRVCKVFGLDPDKTRNITVHFEPENVVYARAEIALEEEQVESVIKLMGGEDAKPATD